MHFRYALMFAPLAALGLGVEPLAPPLEESPPSAPRPPSCWISCESGFGFDGALIVCGWLTSLRVSEKSIEMSETPLPEPAGGAMSSDTASFRSRWSDSPE